MNGVIFRRGRKRGAVVDVFTVDRGIIRRSLGFGFGGLFLLQGGGFLGPLLAILMGSLVGLLISPIPLGMGAIVPRRMRIARRARMGVSVTAAMRTAGRLAMRRTGMSRSP